VFREDEAVAADDLAVVGVPDYQLFLGMVGVEVVLVEVERLACAAAGMPEGEFADVAYLVHQQR